jgi:outer membrane cobalamin receptor
LGSYNSIEGQLAGGIHFDDLILQSQIEQVKGNGYRQNSNYDYGNAAVSSQWHGWNFAYARHFGRYANPNYLNFNTYQNNPQYSNNTSSQYYLEISDRTQISYESILFENWQWRSQISGVNRIQNSDIGFGLYEGNMNTLGGVSQLIIPLTPQQTLQTGIDYYEDQVFAGSISSPPKSLVKRKTRGLFLDALTQFNSFIDLDLAARFDQTDFDYQNVLDQTFSYVSGKTSLNGVSPKIALNLHPLEHNKTYFSLSRTYKAPTSEDFATFVPPYVTNTQLQPQLAETFETGIVQDWQNGAASLVYYNSQVSNEIFFNNVSFQNDNVDTTHTGYEASVKQNFWDYFEFRLGYQYQDAFFRGSRYNNIYQSGKKIPGVSAQQFQYALSFSPDLETTMTYLGRSVSDFYIANDIQNVQGQQNGYGVADLKFSKQMSGIKFLFQVRNVWDARYTTYVGWFGGAKQYYPGEGRTLLAGFEYLF